MKNYMEKVALFIDGPNLFYSVKALGFNVDYIKFREVLTKNKYLVQSTFFTAVHEDDNGHCALQPTLDFLSYNGFVLHTKETKNYTDAEGNTKTKGNMDIELCLAAMDLADKIDSLILCSGDGDFEPLVVALQRKGVNVSVVSTIESRPAMIADTLRRRANFFIDLAGLRGLIER